MWVGEGDSHGSFLDSQILEGFCEEKMEVFFSVFSKDILWTHWVDVTGRQTLAFKEGCSKNRVQN